DKESPRDYDCILVVKKDFNFDSPEAKKLQYAKKLFYAHNFTCMEEDLDRCHRLLNLFFFILLIIDYGFIIVSSKGAPDLHGHFLSRAILILFLTS
ncbi:unnamed protein product, partial [marine sediment metagenome]